MNRRSFFQKAAAFVAGCALGVGVRTKAIETITETSTLVFRPSEYCGRWEFTRNELGLEEQITTHKIVVFDTR